MPRHKKGFDCPDSLDKWLVTITPRTYGSGFYSANRPNPANEKYFGDLSPSQAVLYSWLTQEEPRLFNESHDAAEARRAALASFLALTPEARQAWLVASYASVRADEIALDEMP